MGSLSPAMDGGKRSRMPPQGRQQETPEERLLYEGNLCADDGEE
jgi:hypothetical protein